MTGRDRLVVVVIVAGLLAGALWLKVVSPKRAQVTQLSSSIAAAQNTLNQDQSQLTQARSDLVTYANDVATLKQLQTAIPSSDGLPQLIQALSQASHSNHVTFQTLSVGGSSGSSSAAAAPAPTSTTPSSSTTGSSSSSAPAVTFEPLSFNFTFAGTYLDLQRFLNQLDNDTVVKNGQVTARGRLLTVSSVALVPSTTLKGQTTATVAATAYMATSSSASTTPSA